jgi:hypothetical protein
MDKTYRVEIFLSTGICIDAEIYEDEKKRLDDIFHCSIEASERTNKSIVLKTLNGTAWFMSGDVMFLQIYK